MRKCEVVSRVCECVCWCFFFLSTVQCPNSHQQLRPGWRPVPATLSTAVGCVPPPTSRPRRAWRWCPWRDCRWGRRMSRRVPSRAAGGALRKCLTCGWRSCSGWSPGCCTWPACDCLFWVLVLRLFCLCVWGGGRGHPADPRGACPHPTFLPTVPPRLRRPEWGSGRGMRTLALIVLMWVLCVLFFKIII